MKRALLSIFSLYALSAWTSTNCMETAPADSGKLATGKQLENVVVYGSANNFGSASSQMSAITMSKGQILSVPVFLGEPDVLKSLQKFPGVQPSTDGTAGLFVRGGDYDQNYITLDGSAIYNAEHLKGYVSAINPDMVGNINFYRGAFPARYGSRLSSVVDVGIKEGDYNKYHGLLSLGMLTSRIQVEGPIWKGHTSFNVAARISYFNLIAKPILEHFYDQPTAMRPYSNMKYYDITAKLVHKFNERSRLSALFYYGNDNDSETPTESFQHINTIDNPTVLTNSQRIEDYRRSNNSESKWNNLLTSVYFTTFLTPYHRLNINVNYSQYLYDMSVFNQINNKITDRYRLYYTHDEINSIATHSGIKDMALTADASLRVGDRHHLRYGVKLSRQLLSPYTKVLKDATVMRYRGGLNYDKDETNIEDPKYITSHEYIDYKRGDNLYVNNASAYAEDDFSIYRGLKLNYGLRFNSYFVTDKSYFAIEPRLSLKQTIAQNLSAKASYSYMTQGIHRLVTNNLIMPSDIWVPITKNVPLMRSHLWGLGVNYEVAGFCFSAETYYKTLSNVLEYRNGASYFVADQNWQEIVALGKGRSYGFELLAERKVGNTTGWVSYTWSKALRKFDQPGNEINGGKEFYASTDRRNNLSINISQHFPVSKKVAIDLSASWSYLSGRRGTVPYNVIWGQTIREYGGKTPVMSYGETLFEIMTWWTSQGNDEVVRNRFTGIGGIGQSFQTFSKVNDYKLPDIHHLDINATISFKHRLGESIVGIGVYNVYNHFNVSSAYFGYSDNKAVLKGICPFPIMPSISFTQKF